MVEARDLHLKKAMMTRTLDNDMLAQNPLLFQNSNMLGVSTLCICLCVSLSLMMTRREQQEAEEQSRTNRSEPQCQRWRNPRYCAETFFPDPRQLVV